MLYYIWVCLQAVVISQQLSVWLYTRQLCAQFPLGDLVILIFSFKIKPGDEFHHSSCNVSKMISSAYLLKSQLAIIRKFGGKWRLEC